LKGYEKEIAEAITEALDIKTTHGSEMLEVFRGIRSQLSNLISGINKNPIKYSSWFKSKMERKSNLNRLYVDDG